MRLAGFACLIACSGAAFSQTTGAPPTFEAADVRVSPHSANPFPYMKGPFIRGGLYEVKTATMLDLISAAYGMEADKVVGGPSWLEMDRFDVIAKLPPDSTPETRKSMLRALLADRFALSIHNDTKPLPAYVLTVGKRPALKKSDGAGEPGCKLTRPNAAPPSGGAASGPVPLPMFLYSCHNMTMGSFAEGMRNMALSFFYVGDNMVVDKTGLEGAWDFDFQYTQRGRTAAASDTVTLFDAIDKQLGLKLEPAQVPMPVIVVDSVNRVPTGNPPGVTESLHVAPPPTEFDVAAVKPTDPDYKGMNFQIQPGGRVNLQGVTLKLLIEQAWNLTDDMLVGTPKWMDTDRFDIVAKASAAAFASSSGEMDIDIDAVWLMLRSLLADRFKLVTHTEERPVSAYTLLAVKPKMKKADPSSRTRFREGPASLDAKDPRNSNPALARLVTCQNMTMAQFAEKLQSIAPGYIHSPVLDATGLDGAWDFTLSFSPAGMAQGGGGRGGDSGAATEASDPSTGLTLLEAVEKQIGLKLELRKRPIPVLVIDHAEQNPDN